MKRAIRHSVLIVEDEPELQWALRERGFTVAPDAEAAIALLADGTFIAVFTDINGIESRGYTAATVITMAQSLGLPIACVSGNPVAAQELGDRFGIAAISKTEIEEYLDENSIGEGA